MKRAIHDRAVLLILLAGVSGAHAGAHPISATAARGKLGGKVYHRSANGVMVPEKFVEVSLDETGSNQITNDKGVFEFPLLPHLRPNDFVTLSIDRQGWQIFEPPDGRIRIPRTDTEFVRVRLLPEGSPDFLAGDRIERLIGNSAEKAKQREASEASEGTPGRRKPQGSSQLPFSPAVRPAQGIALAAHRHGLSRPLAFAGSIPSPVTSPPPAPDFDRSIREWATRHGFSVEEVQTAISRWTAEVESRREDPHRLGLAAFARKQFAEAARHFRQSALLRARNRQRDDLVGDLRLEGDSFYYGGDARKALQSYQEAHRHTSREETPALWAATLQDTALAHARLASQSSSEAGRVHIDAAVQAYRDILLVYTRERLPRPWAMAQNNLAIALRAQAKRADGQRGAQLVAQAVEAHRKALEVHTFDQLPEDWARSQNNLGVALQDQASRTAGESGVTLLDQAVEAFHLALSVRTQKAFPEQWARTQSNLGNALQDQALRTQDAEARRQLLAQAVRAYHDAFRVFTREQFPEDWARTQNNLGNALRTQAEGTTGEPGAKLLDEAVHAFEQALSVRTLEDFPQQWALTQNNLGNALQTQAVRMGGEKGDRLLDEAIRAYQQALGVHTREQFPQDWATAQLNLGAALAAHGRQGEAADVLSEILAGNPEDRQAFYSLTELLINNLYDPARALSIIQPWTTRHEEDLPARLREIEALFAIGAFADCRTKAAALRDTQELAPRSEAVLLGYQIGAGVAAGSPGVSVDLALLLDLVAGQPSSFSVGGTFAGALHSLHLGQPVHRAWLVRFFQALAAPDRDSMVQQLRALQQELEIETSKTAPS